MRTKLVFIFSCINLFIGYSQFGEMYWNNFSSFNPAMSGLIYKHHGTLMHGIHNFGLPGVPYHITSLYDCAVDKVHGGIGFTYYHDRNGPINRDILISNYAYHFKFDDDKILGIGISPKYVRTALVKKRLLTGDEDDPLLDNNGTKLVLNSFGINFGIGFKSRTIESGISINYVEGDELTEENLTFAFFRYKFIINNKFFIQPGIEWVNYNEHLNNMFYFINQSLTFSYKERIWICGTHRESFEYPYDEDDFGFGIGYDIVGKFRIGYLRYLTIQEKYNYHYDEIVLSIMLK